MKVEYIPFVELKKNNRQYVLMLPAYAPFDETIEICHEFAKNVADMQKAAQDEQLKQEMAAQAQEGASDANQ